MNRIELLGLILLFAVGVIFLLKSKMFDRFCKWLASPFATSVEELKNDKKTLEKNKQEVASELKRQEKQLNRNIDEFKNL